MTAVKIVYLKYGLFVNLVIKKLGTGGDLKKGSFRKDHEIKFELFQQLLMNQNKPNVIQTKLF